MAAKSASRWSGSSRETSRNARPNQPPRGGAGAPGVVNPANVSAVSFDVDGTLYSDRFLPARVTLESLRRGSLRDLRRLRGRRDLAAEVSERRAAEERVLIPVLRRIGPRPGVVELLKRLPPRTVVAVSDFEPEAKLEALGLRSCFDRVYAAERHGALKPDPRVFEAVLADLGIPPSALLHVGNRADFDGVGARAAGCQALLLGEDFPSFGDLQHRLAL